jgi:hypothetical protein
LNQYWDDDNVQFPRLLVEINAVGLTEEQYSDLCKSMQCSKEEIVSLLNRAEKTFEALHRQLNNFED